MKPFETERLLIRPLEMGDLNELYALYRDPAVMRYVTGEPRDRAATVAALERHLKDHRDHGYGLCAAILKTDGPGAGRFVGRCGLIPWREEGPWQAELAWLFAPEVWGQGLGTEFGRAMIDQAWESLGLSRLMARAYRDNGASVAIMGKLGMSLARELPDEVYYEIRKPG